MNGLGKHGKEILVWVFRRTVRVAPKWVNSGGQRVAWLFLAAG